MSHFRRRVLLNSFKLADTLILAFSFGVAGIIVQQSTTLSLEQFLAMRISMANIVLALLLVLCWHSLFVALGLYYSMRLSSRYSEVIEIIKATTIGTVMIYVAANLFNILMITPLFLAVFWETTTVLTILSRVLLRSFLGRVRVSGRNLRKILLVGTNERAALSKSELADRCRTDVWSLCREVATVLEGLGYEVSDHN